MSEGGGPKAPRKPPSRDELLSLLDAEIEHARAEPSREGWTTWAGLLAIGTLLVLMAEVWEHGGLEFPEVALVLVGGSLLVDAFLGPRHRYADLHGTRPRFWIHSILGRRPAAFSIKVVRAIVMAGLAFSLRDRIWPVLAYGISALYALFALMLIFLVVLMKLGRPFPAPKGSTEGLAALSNVTSGVLGGVCLLYVQIPLPGSGDPNIRFALLALAALFILEYLVEHRYREPMLDVLVELRRRLVLGGEDTRSVQDRARAALLGMEIGDWFRTDLADLIQELQARAAKAAALLNGLGEVQAKAKARAGVATISTPRVSAGAFSELVRKDVEMLERGIRELLESTESLKSLQAKLASKTKWAASLGFTGQGDEQFFDTLSQAVENRFQAERQLLEQLEQLKAQLYQDAKD